MPPAAARPRARSRRGGEAYREQLGDDEHAPRTRLTIATRWAPAGEARKTGRGPPPAPLAPGTQGRAATVASAPGRRRWAACRLRGLTLQVRDLLGLAVGLLLVARELVLSLALPLFLATLVMQRLVAGDVAGRLLGLARDLVGETH